MRLSLSFQFVLATGLLSAAACGGGDDGGTSVGGSGGTGGTGGSGAPMFRGECASTDEIGVFIVQHEPDYSVVSGEVLSGVVPSKILFEVGTEGDCTLWQRKNPFCDPPCKPGDTCDQSGACVPYPMPKSVGAVSVSGLAKAVEMAPMSYYDTNMPHPAFAPGAAITLKAAGGDYPGFTLYGEGFAPIAIPNETWTITKGQPLTITWTPDSSAPHATVRVRLNIDQHGNSPVELVCDVKDMGTVTIPASLIDQLVGFGVTGFPSGHVSRHTLDSTNVGPGCVRFEVFSHVLGDLQVAGHIPCDAATPCPMGMTCDLMTGTCL
ncbi:MAG: hypothetical protein L6Q76_31115 [Polyangiaceae bacterium]|nr:hypothetical protein [Polyangiaceae bacterium]